MFKSLTYTDVDKQNPSCLQYHLLHCSLLDSWYCSIVNCFQFAERHCMAHVWCKKTHPTSHLLDLLHVHVYGHYICSTGQFCLFCPHLLIVQVWPYSYGYNLLLCFLFIFKIPINFIFVIFPIQVYFSKNSLHYKQLHNYICVNLHFLLYSQGGLCNEKHMTM